MHLEGLPLYFYALIFLLGACLLVPASRVVYRELHTIARHLGVPPFFVASLLVAFSTSIPELYIGIDSALHNVPSFALGNILGANILGLSLITGTIVLISRKKLDLATHIDPRHLTVSLFFSSIPLLMLLDGRITRAEGFWLLGIYFFYLIFSIRTRKHNPHDHPPHVSRKFWVSISIFLGAAVLVAAASQLLFSSALALSKTFQISPLIIGVFALSFSTTFPEWSFGIRSALKGKTELLLADIVGANVVNACGILGLIAVLSPITPSNPKEALLAAAYMVALYFVFYFFFVNQKVRKLHGLLLIFFYFCFVAISFFSFF